MKRENFSGYICCFSGYICCALFYSKPGWYELRTAQPDEAVSAFLKITISEGKMSSADYFVAVVSVVRAVKHGAFHGRSWSI
jgi:hypothetical protein